MKENTDGVLDLESNPGDAFLKEDITSLLNELLPGEEKIEPLRVFYEVAKDSVAAKSWHRI